MPRISAPAFWPYLTVFERMFIFICADKSRMWIHGIWFPFHLNSPTWSHFSVEFVDTAPSFRAQNIKAKLFSVEKDEYRSKFYNGVFMKRPVRVIKFLAEIKFSLGHTYFKAWWPMERAEGFTFMISCNLGFENH